MPQVPHALTSALACAAGFLLAGGCQPRSGAGAGGPTSAASDASTKPPAISAVSSASASVAPDAASSAPPPDAAPSEAFTESDKPHDDDTLPCARHFTSKGPLCACVGTALAAQDAAETGSPSTCEITRRLSPDGRLALIEVAVKDGILERFIADLTPNNTMLLHRVGRARVGDHRLGLGVKGRYQSTLDPIEEKPSGTPPLVIVRWKVETTIPTDMVTLAEITGWQTRTESWAAYCVPPTAKDGDLRCNVAALTELVVEESHTPTGGKTTTKKSITKTRATIKDGAITFAVTKGKADDLPSTSVGTFQL